MGLFGGFATPVEAAAIVAAYALLITTCIHRDLRPLADVPRVIRDCGMLVGGVLLILGVALGFTHYLVSAQVPDNLVEWSTRVIKSKWLFLLGLNLTGSRALGNHFLSQYGIGLFGSSYWIEFVAVILPVQCADCPSHAGDPSHALRIARGRATDHLFPTAHNLAAWLPQVST